MSFEVLASRSSACSSQAITEHAGILIALRSSFRRSLLNRWGRNEGVRLKVSIDERRGTVAGHFVGVQASACGRLPKG